MILKQLILNSLGCHTLQRAWLNTTIGSRLFSHCIQKSTRSSVCDISMCRLLIKKTASSSTTPQSSGCCRTISTICTNHKHQLTIKPANIQLKYVPTRSPCVSYSTKSSLKSYVPLLSVKRPVRKKNVGAENEMNDVLHVTAYAASDEIFLQQFQQAIEKQGLYIVQALPQDVTDALFVRAKYKVSDLPREIFFFREGTAVFWNVPEVERGEVLKFVQNNSDSPYDMNLIIYEHEHMEYKYTPSETTLLEDRIMLSEKESEPGVTTLEKYSFSNALSQSVKLGIWEASLETFAAMLEPVTEDMRDGFKIRMSRRNVLRRTGELFALRHSINLSSDLLDTPDFYWDRAEMETLFQRACNHLNITRRTRVMNEKLNHCCELVELLSSHLNDVHHTRLEWMIIILILVEVVFEIVHYAERYFANQEQFLAADASQHGHTPSR